MRMTLLATLAIAASAVFALAEEPAGEKDKWDKHRGDLPFIVGYAKGNAEAKFTGKPPMYFFTATW